MWANRLCYPSKPKIANYHFTTIYPNLGICDYNGYSFVVADIPGIIEGASQGAGLGFDFLRHIERTRMLLHVIDISGSEERDPLDDFDAIMKELRSYGELRDKKMIVAANKTDLCPDSTNLVRLRQKLKPMGIEVYPISAATKQGLEELLQAVTKDLQSIPYTEPFEEDASEPVPEQKTYEVIPTAKGYVVQGSLIEELVRHVNFGDMDSLNYFHTSLRKSGVIDALRSAGAADGDTVIIEEMEFDFTE